MKFKKISKKSLFVQELLFTLIWVTVLAFPYNYLDKHTVLWNTTMLVLLIIFIFFSFCYFPIKYKNTKYLIGDKKIYFQTGVIIKKLSIMNRKSIISVTLMHSLLTPLFKIASISFNAAGSSIHIPYLDIEDAQSIVSELSPLSEL